MSHPVRFHGIIEIIIVMIDLIIRGDDDVTMTTVPADSGDGLYGWPPLTVWLTGLILGEWSSVE